MTSKAFDKKGYENKPYNKPNKKYFGTTSMKIFCLWTEDGVKHYVTLS